jgi:hypothetical protein
MRTTIDLPDALVRAARVRAAQSDETLKELFTRALTHELERQPRKTRRALPVVGSRRPGASTVTAEELEQILADDDAEDSA